MAKVQSGGAEDEPSPLFAPGTAPPAPRGSGRDEASQVGVEPQADEPLTDEQVKAVEYDAGPLMVLAGPGTGKTRVITRRIAHLIKNRAIRPETIVAVTYTVKAAAQLRERLVKLVGADADMVHAHTFHGLGLQILRRFGDEIDVSASGFTNGGGGGGGILDSAQQRRALREIVLENGLFVRARAQGLDVVTDRLSAFAETLSNHAIAPREALKFGAEAMEQLKVGKNHGGRVLDGEELAAEQERVMELIESARALEQFERRCRERGWMNFGDLLTLPIRILRTSKHAAAILRDEWRHMVVDELQDVNPAQLEMLRLLMPPTAESPTRRAPDLCVVGDDDQSIYMFRGADDLAFRHFKNTWPEATTVPLTGNYRSTAPIVAAANITIGKASHRFEPDKVIRAAGAPAGAPVPIECIRLEDELQDGEVIAAWLRADVAETPGRVWSDVAVIVKSHADGERIRLALEIEGIPAAASREGSPADDEGVRTVLAWVRLLAEPHASHVVGQILRRPPYSMDPRAMQQVLMQYRARLSRFRNADPGAPDPGGFADWLGVAAPEDAIAGAFVAMHAALRSEAAAAPASTMIESIIRRTDAAHTDLLGAPERARRVTNLVCLVRFARERQDRLDAPGDVRAFQMYWDDLSDGERKFKTMGGDDRVEGSGADEGSERPNMVRVMTAHSAKGLEFKTVFVPRASPSHGYGAVKGGDQVDLPTGLIPVIDGRTPKQRAKAEQRRLFYVACTRAEERLVVLAKGNKKPSRSEHYFEELLYETGPLAEQRRVRQGEEVLRKATMRRNAGWDGGALGGAPLSPDAAERRREAFESARREVRTAAAGALDGAGGAAGARQEVERAAEALAECGRRIGALADAERTGTVPVWAEGTPAGALARSVLERAGSGEQVAAGGPGWPGLVAPLDLSYTKIDAYLKCPRCFYLNHVLKLEPIQDAQQIIGQVVHKAMERFYRAVQVAQGDGRPGPDRDALLAMGHAEFMRNWPREREIDGAQLDRSKAQLGLAFDRLYQASAHTLEVEKSVEFAFGPHRFQAKIDRIDQYTDENGAPAFRIVDYKSGRASKPLTEPKPGDLQLGVYAMALAHLYGLGDPREASIAGVAEYWLLSTGEIGRIRLADINFEKVDNTIKEAIDGMTAGRWERSPKCKGDCGMFGDGPSVEVQEGVEEE